MKGPPKTGSDNNVGRDPRERDWRKQRTDLQSPQTQLSSNTRIKSTKESGETEGHSLETPAVEKGKAMINHV